MALLQASGGATDGQTWSLDRERIILGRHPDCDVVLEAAAVSRQHAQIIRDGDNFLLEDLHSRNGTIVNGERLQDRHLLHDGDRLRIGDLAFTFHRQRPITGAQRIAPLVGSSASFSLLDDEADTERGSKIVSKLDVLSSHEGARLTVNPEVKLRAMIEITQNLARSVSVEQILPNLLESLFKIFLQADRAFVIFRSADGTLIPKSIKFRREQNADSVRVSRTIVKQVMETREAILSADASSDIRFDSSQSIADLRIRSVMCAPLVNADGVAQGVIQVDTMDQRHRFTKEDLEVLVSIASQAATAIDNAQLHEQQLRQQAVQRDLELAHKVQRGLLPAQPPQFPGYHFFDFYEPAYQVGGDYYDYIELPDDRLAVVLGDVSGKGVSAALLMAKLSGDVRYSLASERRPAAAVDRINRSFCRSGWEDRFVTFILVVLDLRSHEVVLVNAGHMAPLLRHGAGRVEPIGDDVAGLPLGVDASFQYQQYTHQLGPGDFVTIFTDGISEAMNVKGTLYGIPRLARIVGTTTASVADLGKMILDDVKKFVGGRPQSDDMCLACFGRGID